MTRNDTAEERTLFGVAVVNVGAHPRRLRRGSDALASGAAQGSASAHSHLRRGRLSSQTSLLNFNTPSPNRRTALIACRFEKQPKFDEIDPGFGDQTPGP